MLEIYLDYKFSWPEEILNRETLAYEIVTKPTELTWPSGFNNYFYFLCKRFAVQTLLWSLEFLIKVNLEYSTIVVWNLPRSWSISIEILFLLHHIISLHFSNCNYMVVILFDPPDLPFYAYLILLTYSWRHDYIITNLHFSLNENIPDAQIKIW